jgi:hypothetical protein
MPATRGPIDPTGQDGASAQADGLTPRPQIDANKIVDPKEWLIRAMAMRIIAEKIQNEECRAIVLRLADNYERLAKFAERCAGVQGRN